MRAILETQSQQTNVAQNLLPFGSSLLLNSNQTIIMQSWFQICNLRTTLLHLQFIYASLKEKMEKQQVAVQRSHRDRVMQYYCLWQDYLTLEDSNFKRLIIIKLQSCLAVYAQDEQLWQVLDQFKKYAHIIEQQMLENMSKIYIGKKVMFDIGQVQKALVEIQAKIVAFLSKHSAAIQEYHKNLVSLESARDLFGKYLAQVKSLYKQIEGGYSSYLMKRLKRRSKEIDENLKELKSALTK